MSDLQESIAELLADKSLRGEARVIALADLLDAGPVFEVWPLKTRVEVEQVEAYGLTIGLDANGDACRVEFPWGADTDG